MPGRWTLTATRSPLWRTARWTWPIDAAANETGSNDVEDRLGLAAELLADDLPDVGVRERRDLVQQLEQFVAVGGRQQVEPQGEHLAQLDPGAAQAFEVPAASGPARSADRTRAGAAPAR